MWDDEHGNLKLIMENKEEDCDIIPLNPRLPGGGGGLGEKDIRRRKKLVYSR